MVLEICYCKIEITLLGVIYFCLLPGKYSHVLTREWVFFGSGYDQPGFHCINQLVFSSVRFISGTGKANIAVNRCRFSFA